MTPRPPDKGKEISVESACNALARSGLLPGNDVRALYGRWQREGGQQVGSAQAFTGWLAAQGRLTEHQAAVVARGNADQLTLGPYRVLERIGKGRFAGVYRAIHPTGQVVAIKVLPPSKAKDPQILARFRREARLALRLNHPNVVRTFQEGHEKGLHYLVMECLEGETLGEILQRRKKLPPDEAVRLIYQALQGLQHVHEKGLVHRDLKPANLMIVGGDRSPPNPTAKIVDIGTGRALFAEEDPESPDFERTNEAEVLGTAEYMAPEQARDPHVVDIRADIYALGCIFYHALAGQPPFAEKNRVRVLVRHATETPRPVRERSPEVPEGLQQIVDWMLAKDPAQRYPTPARAAGALQVFLAAGAEPVTEENPKTRAYRAWLATQSTTDAEAPRPSATREAAPAASPPPPPIPKGGGTRKVSAPARPPAPPSRPKPPPPPPRPTPVRIDENAVDVELIPAEILDAELLDPEGEAPSPRRGLILLLLGLALGLFLFLAVGVGLVVTFFLL